MNTKLTQFRNKVYQNFRNYKWPEALMELLDALSSNTQARKVVELSLSPHFRRHYSALNKAIVAGSLSNQQLARLASHEVGVLRSRQFYLPGTDVTSNLRPYAHTLPDRSFVYHPATMRGNKPVAIGHRYSLWAFLLSLSKVQILDTPFTMCRRFGC